MAETSYIPDPMPDSYETGGGLADSFGRVAVITEEDGSPSVSNVSTIVFPSGTVTDDGGGQVSIAAGSSGLYGTGSPEGSVSGSRGQTYVDTSSQAFYVKVSGDNTTTGWLALIV